MRFSIKPLIFLLLLQLGLAGALLLRHNPLAADRTDATLLPAGLAQKADRIVIEGHGAAPAAPGAAGATAASKLEQVVLQQKGGVWVLPDAFDAPADAARVRSLIDRLANLRRGLPIATSEAALRRFKVTDSDFERRLVFSAGGGTLDTVYVGSSPGLRKANARTSADRAVYAVDLPSYELPTEVSAWLSGDLIRVDTASLTGLDVSGEHGTLQLTRQKPSGKQPESWIAADLKGAERLDDAHVVTLVQQIGDLHVEGVLGTAPRPEWQQDHPLLTLDLKAEKAAAVQWVLSKSGQGDFYVLKASSHPWYFSISTAAGKDLVDAAARSALLATATKAAPSGARAADKPGKSLRADPEKRP